MVGLQGLLLTVARVVLVITIATAAMLRAVLVALLWTSSKVLVPGVVIASCIIHLNKVSPKTLHDADHISPTWSPCWPGANTGWLYWTLGLIP